jgi:NAD(P)H dehydrogenase (quinone)
MAQSTLLVSGASGHLGRRVVELLLDGGNHHIIALTRSPERLSDLARRGAEVRAASFDDPGTLPAAFSGARRALIISTDAVGRRVAQHGAALQAAVAAGVEHVLYTSLVHPGPDSPVTLAPEHFATERAIADGAKSFTILRNNLYTDYLLPGLPHALRAGRIENSFGDGAVSYVTREDCARAAAAALASDFEGRRTLDITGPAAITQAELAAIVSEVAGRPVSYAAVSPDAAQRNFLGAGLPEPVAALLVSFERAGTAGHLGVTSPAVRELTGAPAASVRDFLREHRAAFV